MPKTNKIAEGLSLDRQKGTLSWIFDGQDITIDCPGVDQAIISDKQRAIITLAGEDNTPSVLIAFAFDGSEIFRASAPSPFNFYYLSNHPEVDVSVVCVTREPIDGWRDWHFGVDVKQKKIFRHCPAY